MDIQFVIYLIGYALIVGGVAFGMRAAGLGDEWVLAVVLVLGGVGLIGAMSRTIANGRRRA